MEQNVYGISDTELFINSRVQEGYELVQLSEGTLGLGSLVLLSNDDNKYNYVIREVFINEWSSGQTIRRAAKISKALQAEIDNAEG